MNVRSLLSLFILLFLVSLSIEEKQSYIIVGGGISGVAAGRALLNAGHDVKVLEARNRVGGRIDTVDIDNNKIDFGASWIHEAEPNHPVYKLAKKFNLKTIIVDEPNKVISKDSNGNPEEITASEISSGRSEFQKEFLNPLIDAIPKITVGQSLYDFIKSQNLLDKLKSNKYYAALLAGIENDYATSFESLSALLLAKSNKEETEDDGPEVEELMLVNGYKDIIDNLINGVNGEKKLDVVTGKVVNDITVQNEKATVKTKDGGSYTGNAAIVTVPLGVLKANTITFSPPLSQAKRDAINKIGFGTLNKVYLEFNEKFMDNSIHLYTYIPDEFNQRSYLTLFYNFGRLTNKATVVVISPVVPGYSIETGTDDELKNECFTRLSILFNKPTSYFESNLKTMRRTKWSQDEFSRGSYSHPTKGTTENDYKELGKTHANKVLFAGEHTYIEDIGTVTGAYITGLRAACQLDKSISCSSPAAKLVTSYYTILSALTFFILLKHFI